MIRCETDYYTEAVFAWQKANKNLKHFAECCYHVDNKIALAADCCCSVRTIQFYAAAWSLFLELSREYEATSVSLLWERGEISLWRKAPELRSRYELSLAQTRDYLETAVENNMTRESFAAHVDEKENDTPQWIRRLQSICASLKKISGDYKGADMPGAAQERLRQANEWYANELNEIMRLK